MPSSTEPSDEGGFILIEVLVSALILALVAGAVLALITATTHSAATERAHSQAYGLAQEDQARLRTMRISKLNNFHQTQYESIDGTQYTIESRGTFVNDKSGTTSCSGQNASADYVKIASSVSAPTMLNPVSIQSVVSPSTGSIDPTHGTLSLQFSNAAGESLPGVSISGTGPANLTGASEENGCAVFADKPSGTYRLTISAGGLITPQGSTSVTKEIGIEAGTTQQVSMSFDKAATVKPSFVYKEPSTNTLLPAPVDSMVLFDSEGEAVVFGTPGGTRQSTLEDTLVYPYKTSYAVYAGSCEQSNDPDPKEEGLNKAAIASLAVTGGSVQTPQIQVPALNLGVTYGSGVVQGAKIVLTDTKCTYNGSKVKRTFTTNEVGHIAAVTSGKTEAAGLPWGTYNVCISAKISGVSNYRKVEASSLSVENLTTALSKTFTLSGSNTAGSSFSSSSECS